MHRLGKKKSGVYLLKKKIKKIENGQLELFLLLPFFRGKSQYLNWWKFWSHLLQGSYCGDFLAQYYLSYSFCNADGIAGSHIVI